MRKKLGMGKIKEKEKETDGSLMKTDDDKKEDLTNETIWSTIGMAGGPLTWLLILSSFVSQ